MSIARPRLGALAVVAAASLLALVGCATTDSGDNTGASADEATPVLGGTLVHEFLPDSVKNIDPFQVFWIEHRSIIRNFADSLTDQDPETGEIVPWIATDWEVSADGLTYIFNLRDDVTFADETPLDAAAVVANFELWQSTVEAVPSVFGASYIAGFDSAVAVDDDTVEIHFSTPNGGFLQATSTTTLALLSPTAFAGTTPEERALGVGVVGSGPFVLDKYEPGVGVDLSKRIGYNWASELNDHQGEAYLDAIRVNYVAEDTVRAGNLTAGASDISWPRNPFTPEQIDLFTSVGATVESRSLPGPANNFYPNTARVLGDKLVRQALQKAIDRDTYAATLYGADYPVVEGPLDNTTPYYQSYADALAYDPDGAAELLDEAGWTLETGATYRTKNGETLTLILNTTADSPGNALLQDQLKQVGIDLQLPIWTTSDAQAVIAKGEWDLQATYFTRGDPSVAAFILDPRYSTSKTIANGQPADALEQIQDLTDQGLEATDSTVRGEVYQEFQDLLIDEALTFPLFERVQQAGVAENVHGFRYTSEAFVSWYDVWKE